ncbi:hypothetical protein BGZ61DRAFT_355781 [Ilyonectria robusta]|uniref:uncharacterized protein n=1 Tax=Ilyonectria robusta TaxID=1079257 RepID=UPI001E8CD3A4|nr:uncharacterized protein BGZ61DRAFT_355781 [Ilyonectria robusta]KAH8686590.1 hypothetical protein BGZ61DRAFT_355781 [Ilyonectria robusta]
MAIWPWRGDDSSTASFEKTLSTLSTKITDTQSLLDRVRSSSRRARVLWTLYLSFAYLVYTIVLLLVIGYKNLGAYEWTGLVGGPVLIYLTRTTLDAFYTFRIESLTANLKEYQQEREKTIKKLKDATKYDSTMELIEKYGGQESRPKGKKKGTGDGDGDDNPQKGKKGNAAPAASNRTRIPPPATANIQRRDGPAVPSRNQMEPGAEFAPNAEFAPSAFPGGQAPPSPTGYPQYNATPSEPHWYDRIFDVLLGDDETAVKNRIVLICHSCRLVNGQAPPGTKTLSDLGPWKCMSCGTLNGELDEGKRIVNEVLGQAAEHAAVKQEDTTDDDAEDASSDDVVDVAKEHILEEVQQESNDGPAAAVRKRRGKGKK